MDTTFPETQAIPQKLHITSEVLGQIRDTIGSMPAEQGGILGGSREEGGISHFFFDRNAKDRSSSSYTPNVKKLNRIIKHRWKPQGIDFIGFVHSHPPYTLAPSVGDREYAKRILEDMDLPYLLIPIVTTIPDTDSFCLFPFTAYRTEFGMGFTRQMLIIDDDDEAVDFERQEQEKKAEPNEFGLLVAAIDELLTAQERAATSFKNLTMASLAVLETAQALYWRDALKDNRSKNNG